MVAESSLDEIELAAFLNDERLPGPTRPFPGAGIAGAKGRLSRTECSLPLDTEFGGSLISVKVALVVAEVSADERLDLGREADAGEKKDEKFHSFRRRL